MRLGFIGTGEIAKAIVVGFCRSTVSDLSMMVSPRGQETSKALAQTYNQVERCRSNQEVLDRCDIAVLAVPPSDALEVVKGLIFRPEQQVISVVPFLLLADLQRAASPARHCCRAIPLPTVAHHRCPIPVLNGNEELLALLQAIGQPFAVDDERHLHVLWTLTGLIAPFYDWLGTLGRWSSEQGVDPVLADRFAVDMVEALCVSAQQTPPLSFTELSHHAATPRGMNEQAAREIHGQDCHAAYAQVLDRLLARFPQV